MKTFRAIVMGVLLLLFTIVVAQNTEVITVNLFAWEFSLSLIVLLVLVLLIGLAVGYLAARIASARRRSQTPVQKTATEVPRV